MEGVIYCIMGEGGSSEVIKFYSVQKGSQNKKVLSKITVIYCEW